MADTLQGYAAHPLGPYKSAIAPTLSDTVDDPAGVAQAIVCTGTAGNISVVLQDGSTITVAIASGWVGLALLRVKRVKTSGAGTTATGLYLLYV